MRGRQEGNLPVFLAATAAATLLGLTAAHAQDAASTAPPPAGTKLSLQFTPTIVSESFNGSVVRVVDDRTLVVHRDDRDEDAMIVLFGVKSVSATAPNGKSARAYLTDKLKNAKVRVEGRGRDHAGNLSALVSLVPPTVPHLQQPPDVTGIGSDLPYRATAAPVDSPQKEKSINETIVSLGLARYDFRTAPDEKSLADAEADAQKGQKGFWSNTATVSSAELPEKP